MRRYVHDDLIVQLDALGPFRRAPQLTLNSHDMQDPNCPINVSLTYEGKTYIAGYRARDYDLTSLQLLGDLDLYYSAALKKHGITTRRFYQSITFKSPPVLSIPCTEHTPAESSEKAMPARQSS